MREENKNLDAAEYVIGTLSAGERKNYEALLDTDEEANIHVSSWQRIFGGLNATISPEIPPSHIWDKIKIALSDSETNAYDNDNYIAMARSRSRWRMGAIAASVLALGSFGFLVTSLQTANFQSESFVAVVNAAGDKPALIVQVDGKTGKVTVRSFGMEKPQGKSLQLWYVPEDKNVVPVGLVGEGKLDLGGVKPSHDTLFAISLEPEGGSPTGSRTGPVVYTGKLIRNPKAE